ncbi:MAG: DUF1343 domain-containing protein [Gemmatimonadetes bacterium]|nr:DUF1343 domain-containing protein [Gemmatimonadota bacterium]
MSRLAAFLLVTPLLCASMPAPGPGTPSSKPRAPVVRPGVEVFVANPPAVVKGKRIGLITNQSGIDRQRRSTIDLIRAMPGVTLVALFSPEHGIRGVAETRVESSTDERTGLPIYSLYGETREPTPEMLKDVDVLVYDIQDLGVRQYTFESTMALAMKAAARKGIPFVVLDRPNPVTGTILEGNRLEPGFETFVGIYPVLSRHGMTVGELAKMYNAEQHIGADLTVVPMQGWRRDMWFDETGLPWVNPSPNIRRLEAAIHYPGTVFFEAVNVSEGRGTSAPFEQIGAPWLDNVRLAATMNAMKLPGVRFEAVDIPTDSAARKYPGQTLKGVRFVITDRNAYRPIAASLLVIEQIRKMHPDKFEWRGSNAREPGLLTIERHGGTKKLREAIENGTVAELLKAWERDQAEFAKTRAKYLIYR